MGASKSPAKSDHVINDGGVCALKTQNPNSFLESKFMFVRPRFQKRANDLEFRLKNSARNCVILPYGFHLFLRVQSALHIGN